MQGNNLEIRQHAPNLFHYFEDGSIVMTRSTAQAMLSAVLKVDAIRRHTGPGRPTLEVDADDVLPLSRSRAISELTTRDLAFPRDVITRAGVILFRGANYTHVLKDARGPHYRLRVTRHGELLADETGDDLPVLSCTLSVIIAQHWPAETNKPKDPAARLMLACTIIPGFHWTIEPAVLTH